MTHEALVNVAATTHTAVLLGALAAYYKFGDRTDVLAKSLQGTEQSMRDLRRLIAAELAETLQKDLSSVPTVSTLIVESATESYVERPTSVFAGERYRDSIRRFVEVSSNRLVDCRNLVSLRDAWSRCAQRLSWLILGLVAYEALVAGFLGFLDRTGVLIVPDAVIRWAAAPTVAIAVLCGAYIVAMQRVHDRISEIRLRYADLSE